MASINIGTVYKPFYSYFRGARNARFVSTMNLTSSTTVLDVGGTSSFWELMPIRPKVTLLNTSRDGDGDFPQIIGSACDIPCSDKSYDIVFSNSMIEHLRTWDNQKSAANEMLRVGRKLWVQTPYQWFPVETHLLTPFIHWLPHNCQHRMLRFTTRALLAGSSGEDCEALWSDVRLLTIGEMKLLFPGCQLLYERFGGFVKSLLAIRTT